MKLTAKGVYRERAEDDLREGEAAQASLQYIRRTLDAAGHLSSISGAGTMLVGALAVAAVLLNLRIAARNRTSLIIWAALLAASVVVTAVSMARKSRRARQLFWSPVLRKALWIGTAPMALGAILSYAMIRSANFAFLPVIWLGCYGAALTSAGMMSVTPVRWMGISFLGLSLVAAVLPASAGLALLAAGFGGLHLGFGAFLCWRYDA